MRTTAKSLESEMQNTAAFIPGNDSSLNSSQEEEL